jgi:Flp pilus assembly protein TadD
MLDCSLYGLQPWGHHLTNVLLHGTAAILLFLALLRLTSASSAQQSTLDSRLQFWASAFIAALFAVHPLRVESVAWVAERKDVLSGVFFMLTLLAYANYARAERPSIGKYLLVVIAFALGLMCKPTLVTVPFVLLLLDYWPLKRWRGAGSREQGAKSGARRGKSQGRAPSASQHFSVSAFSSLVVEKIPLFVLSAASCVATLLAQGQALEKSVKLTFIERLANAVASYATYLSQMFYPVHLAVLYPYSNGNLKFAEVILDLGLLLALSVIFFLWHRKYPFLLTGWLWYLGMLVPMIGLVQVGLQTRGDRYTYLPQIGLYILVAWGATELFRKWRLRPAIPAVAATTIVVALTACTYHEVSFWQSGETLWKHVIDNTSNNYTAHYSLGSELLRKHQLDPAVAEFDKALRINPDYADAEMNLGVAFLQKGDLDGAISHTQKAVQIDPKYFEAQYNLGNLLLERGQPDQAISHYQEAVAARPNYAQAHNSLAVALAQKGQLDQAVAEFEEALRLKPDYVEAQTDLGNALASRREFAEAIPHYLEALRLNPNFPQVHYNLGYALLQLGRREEAMAHFTEALRLNPDYNEAKQQLRNLGAPAP